MFRSTKTPFSFWESSEGSNEVAMQVSTEPYPEWKQTMAQIKKFGGRCTSKFKECPCAYADTYQIIFRPRREPENCAIKKTQFTLLSYRD